MAAGDEIVRLRGASLRFWRSAILVVLLGPAVGTVAGLLYAMKFGAEPRHLWMFLGLYLLTAFGVTAGYHRLFAHRSFETSRTMRAILAVLGAMAWQGPVLRWVADHRLHHQHSDDELDLHSPVHGRPSGIRGFAQSMIHAHCGWFFAGTIAQGRYANDLSRDPVVRFVDARYLWWGLLSLMIPGALDLALGGSLRTIAGAVLIAGLGRIFFLQNVTWAVNSLGHTVGTRAFVTKDDSRNNALLGLLALGEGWHNNHHAVPHSARHGFTFWQIDLTWLALRAMEMVGLVWSVKRPRSVS